MNPSDFWEKYELVGTAKEVFEKCKSQDVTICRFCGKGIDETTFNHKPHIIPELLGRNHYLSNFECDVCNQNFSKYESHLATFFRPYLSLLNVKGKRKAPIFQKKEENRNANSITSLKSVDNSKKHLITGNEEDFEIDTENNTLKVVFRNETVIPRHVYKALIRIGLSLLPNKDLYLHKKSFDFINGVDSSDRLGFLRIMYMVTLKRKQFIHPTAYLYKAINYSNSKEEFPNHVLIIGFANQIVQVYLPFSDDFAATHKENKNLSLDIFPGFIFDKLEAGSKVQIRTFDVGIDEKLKIDTTMQFTFDNYERNESDIQY